MKLSAELAVQLTPALRATARRIHNQLQEMEAMDASALDEMEYILDNTKFNEADEAAFSAAIKKNGFDKTLTFLSNNVNTY